MIVRAFDGDGARVTIGTPAENDRFLSAAAELAAQGPAVPTGSAAAVTR